jgi:hypothetical protein
MFRTCCLGRYGRNTRIHGSRELMCVSTINGETNNHMIQEKGPTKNEDIFGTDDSAVILGKK